MNASAVCSTCGGPCYRGSCQCRKCALDSWRRPNCRCKHCGKEYIPKKFDRTTFCSRECFYAWDREHGRPGRRVVKPEPKPILDCVVCGRSTGKRNAKTCSEECRMEYRRQCERTRDKENHDELPRRCKHCGVMFVPEYGNKRRIFCSDRCARSASKREGSHNFNSIGRKKMRSLHGDAWREHYEPINRRKVFERDKWRCQLCGGKIRVTDEWHPKQATIDHIVPLALGGDHTYANVQSCCMECNSQKGATIQGQQRLFGLVDTGRVAISR